MFKTCLIIFQMNNEKLAEMAGFTNPGSAKNAWANIKKKLGLNAKPPGAATDDRDAADATTVTPATTGKGKKRAAKIEKDDGTPSKKPRARKPRDVKVEDDDEDAAPVEGAQEGEEKIKGEQESD